MNIDKEVEAARDKDFMQTVTNLRAGDVQHILKEIVSEDSDMLEALAEDLRSGPTNNLAHAGSILSDGVRRYADKLAEETADKCREDLTESDRARVA